jgi:formin 2
MLRAHVESQPDVPLDKPDQFLLDLLSIPNYEERIVSLTFQVNYFEVVGSIETKLSNLALVCEQLTSSRELQKVLALILTYGNYMNGGNMVRGQADGFTLDILPKLKDVKSKDNSYTFLHFIVNKFIQVRMRILSQLYQFVNLPLFVM